MLDFDQVDAFWRDGWLRVEAVVSVARLHELSEHVRRLRQPPPSERDRYRHYPFQGFIGDKCLAEFTGEELCDSERLMRIHLFDPKTRLLMLDPELLSIARDIFHGGEPLAAHSAYFPKPPSSRGISTHTDNEYFRADPDDIIGCSVAVDEATGENGAIEVVVGTHRSRHAAPRPAPSGDSVLDEEVAVADGASVLRVDAAPGDVILFHANVLHRSPPNRSNRWRRAFIFHYANGDTLRSIGSDCLPLFRGDGSVTNTAATLRRGVSTGGSPDTGG
jgi:hypothetical protein